MPTSFYLGVHMPITSDQLTSYLRTAVPALWGWIITLLLNHFGWLQEVFDTMGFDPMSPVTTGAVTALFFFLWYALWRYLEMRGVLPDAVRRIVLGAASSPQYGAGKHVAGVPDEPRNEVGVAGNRTLVAVVIVVVVVVLVIWFGQQ